MDKIRGEYAEKIVNTILFNKCIDEGYFKKETMKHLKEYDKSCDEEIKKLRDVLEFVTNDLIDLAGSNKNKWNKLLIGRSLEVCLEALKDGE